MEARPADHRELIIMWAFAKLDLAAFVIASAIVTGTFLLLLTLLLVVKGAPPGMPVGPHLAALRAIFPGYTVTVPGALVGGLYAASLGACIGFVVAGIWNLAHALFLAFVRMRANLASYDMD